MSYDVIIAGGGLAGLVAAIELSRAGAVVLVLEKKEYPYHKVCGEYVSHEVTGYLRSLGFDPFHFGASDIKRLRLSAPSGKTFFATLDLGGFGLSRFTMDHQLALLAMSCGATIKTGSRVSGIKFRGADFEVTAGTETYEANWVIGSYGKRDTLDKKLSRPFIDQRTGNLAVKYHIRTDYPVDEIGLDNFKGGYCGISRIEEGKYTLCYLHQRGVNAQAVSIKEFEETVMFRNPVLKNIFSNSEFLYDAPLVINEINFGRKSLIEDHVLMCGDTAGLITPLCGNGMSMAICAARLLCEVILKRDVLKQKTVDPKSRNLLEQEYNASWKKLFQKRLMAGRIIQSFFGNAALTELSLRAIHAIKPLERALIRATHGKVQSLK